MPVPLEGPAGARIMIVGDCSSHEDEYTGRNFSGTSGRMLDQLLSEAGFSRHECLLTMVAKAKPPGGKISFFYEDAKCTKPNLHMQMYIAKLREEIAFHRPNIILALGHVPMYVLTGNIGIAAYRGYICNCTLVPGIKVIPTHHPSGIIHEWKQAFQFVMDARKAIANSRTPEFPPDNRVLDIGYTKTQFIDYLNYLIHDHKGKIAFDVETTSPGSHVDLLGFADSPDHAVSFAILTNRKANYSSYDETEIWLKVQEVLAVKETIMQNGAYDSAVLMENTGILCSGYKYDTMIAAHACWPECPRSLSFLGSICLNVAPWKHTANDNPMLYNAGDAANTYGIWNVLEEEMDKLGTRNTHDFEMSQIFVANMLQLNGILIDKERQEKYIKANKEELTNLQATINTVVGKPINISSPKQMQELLYVDMSLPVQYKRRKSVTEEKKVTTNEEALVKLSRVSDNPILELIMKAKKITKLLTFLDVPLSTSSRVHTCYNVTGATMLRETKGIAVDDEGEYKSFGRWSSSSSIILPFGSGNLQNVPKDARKMYVPPPGEVFVQADYKQAEAVVVAYLIGDTRLKKLFQDSFGLSDEECKARHLDVHKITAAMMFGMPVEAVTPDMRRVGKTIRHAVNYSAGPGVLATKLNISTKEAKKLLDRFHNGCPQLQIWQSHIQQELRQTRMLTNLLGRRHRFIDRWGDGLFRSAYSFVPQSTVGDLLNTALIRLYDNYGDKLNIALQLHDAIYVTVPEGQEEFAKDALRDSMLIPLTCNGETFRIDVDFKSGPTWGDLEE